MGNIPKRPMVSPPSENDPAKDFERLLWKNVDQTIKDRFVHVVATFIEDAQRIHDARQRAAHLGNGRDRVEVSSTMLSAYLRQHGWRGFTSHELGDYLAAADFRLRNDFIEGKTRLFDVSVKGPFK